MDRLFFETKVLADAEGHVAGLAWPFGKPDRVGDVILPGAFRKAIMPIPMLFGHDLSDPVGTWDVATEKQDGLHLTGKMLVKDVIRAREVFALVQSGAAKGMSIGFITKKAKSLPGGGREISELELLEASIVTVPMHSGAKVTSAKSAVRALRLIAAINRATAQLKG